MIIYKDISGDSGEMREDTKQQTKLLRNLKTYTKYTITVFGVDKRGVQGPTAESEVTTKSGGKGPQSSWFGAIFEGIFLIRSFSETAILTLY